MYQYKAQVIRVVDGDTIICNVDLGFTIQLNEIRFRLLGIDAPEMTGSEKELGLQSKKYLQELIEGQVVEISTYKMDSFGRYLATVYKGTTNINVLLRMEGFAKEYKG